MACRFPGAITVGQHSLAARTLLEGYQAAEWSPPKKAYGAAEMSRTNVDRGEAIPACSLLVSARTVTNLPARIPVLFPSAPKWMGIAWLRSARPAPQKASRCVAVEDEVAGFDDLMAGKAGIVHRLTGGLAVVKVGEPPAAGRGVFS